MKYLMKRMTWIVLLIISDRSFIEGGYSQGNIMLRPPGINGNLTEFHANDGTFANEQGLTPKFLSDAAMDNVAVFGDAEHRGPQWYDYDTKSSGESGSDIKSTSDETSLISAYSSSISSSKSSDASSAETDEKRLATQVYRTCTPCPHDMLKKYKNFGIKWICGSYQRARRSFKSECMMRYRNCQDGTMFVKLYDHRCKNDPLHGRHWFYIYKV